MTEGSSNLARVLANVVDIQQSIMLQFDNVVKALDGLKLDHNSAINGLREDLRRTDDRSQKQIDELNSAHQKEVDRLLNIIQTLLNKDAQQTMPQIPPAALLQQQQNAALQHAMFLQNQQQFSQARDMLANQQISQQIAAQNFLLQQQQQKVVVPQPTFAPKPVVPVVPASVAVPAPSKETTPIVPQQLPKPPVVGTPVVIPSNIVPPNVAKVPVVVPQTSTATATPPALPTFTFGSKGSIFGKQPAEQVAAPKTPVAPSSTVIIPKSAEKQEEDDEADEDYEPQAEFKPLIPLPDLVETKTGEEGEEVLFCNRSKLYVFADATKEWKERGLGELKILKDKESKKCRVVMRREQVLKVCANFSIVAGMTAHVMEKNEKAYTWFCEDFSEDEPEHVKFSARFSTVEIAKQFKELFEKAAEEHKALAKTPEKVVKKEEKAEVKPEVEEKPTTSTPSSTGDSPSNKENQSVGFGDKFKPAAGSWECSACYVRNNASDDVCSCCGTGKDGKAADKSASVFSKPSILKPATGTPKFSFGMSAAAVAKEPLGSSGPAPLFGAGSSPASNTSFGASVTPKASIFGGGPQTAGTGSGTPSFSFGKAASAAAAAPAPSSGTPSFSFLKASESAGSGNSSPAVKPSIFGNSAANNTDGNASSSTAVPFSFKPAAEPPKFSFGGSKNTPVADTPKPADEPKAEAADKPTGSVFGSFGGASPAGTLSFASLAAKAKENSIFDGENARKAQEEFKNQKKSTSLIADDSQANNDENDENGEDYEPSVDFKPLIPLPDLVETKTGEEDEEVLFKARCKLFKFFADTKENKERGVGDVKILRNKETNTCRVLMRREQVHKICANFRVTKSIQLTMKQHMPNVYTFVCQDFSEDVENGEGSVFTIKFKDEKIATEFKSKFEEIRESQK